MLKSGTGSINWHLIIRFLVSLFQKAYVMKLIFYNFEIFKVSKLVCALTNAKIKYTLLVLNYITVITNCFVDAGGNPYKYYGVF